MCDALTTQDLLCLRSFHGMYGHGSALTVVTLGEQTFEPVLKAVGNALLDVLKHD